MLKPTRLNVSNQFVVRIQSATSHPDGDKLQGSEQAPEVNQYPKLRVDFPPFLVFVLFHRNRIMAKFENEMHHQGVKAWVEKLKKTRYKIVSVENLGGIARAYLDVIPGLCGSTKVIFDPFVNFFLV